MSFGEIDGGDWFEGLKGESIRMIVQVFVQRYESCMNDIVVYV